MPAVSSDAVHAEAIRNYAISNESWKDIIEFVLIGFGFGPILIATVLRLTRKYPATLHYCHTMEACC